MKIVTWNVNSLRVRLQRVQAWLEKEQPDALCLQELKVEDSAFPFEALEEVGYCAAIHGHWGTKDWMDFLLEDEAVRIIHDIDMKLILGLESLSRDVKEMMVVLPYYSK